MHQQDIQVIKRINSFNKVDLKNFWKLEATSAFPQIAMILLLSWLERKRFYCVAAQHLFVLLKCLETQNWDQNLSLIAAVPIFNLQSKYGNMAAGKPCIAVLSTETWLVELHSWEAYLGLADGSLLLFSQGITHNIAGVCIREDRGLTHGESASLGEPWGSRFTTQEGYPACSFLGEE